MKAPWKPPHGIPKLFDKSFGQLAFPRMAPNVAVDVLGKVKRGPQAPEGSWEGSRGRFSECLATTDLDEGLGQTGSTGTSLTRFA